MADTFKGIVTADGKKRQLPYGSILDLPSSDPSLTVDGGFADAAVVGKNFKKTDDDVASLKEEKINKPEENDNNKIARAKNGEVEWVDVGQPTDEQTAGAVTKWLDKHPEATTTVQDHSLGINKFIFGALGYVTPEMFGAIGNGITDDTKALNDALRYGYTILLQPKTTYLVTGGLYIRHSVNIEGNYSQIIVNDYQPKSDDIYGLIRNTYGITNYDVRISDLTINFNDTNFIVTKSDSPESELSEFVIIFLIGENKTELKNVSVNVAETEKRRHIISATNTVSLKKCKFVNKSYGYSGGVFWVKYGGEDVANIFIDGCYFESHSTDENFASYGVGEKNIIVRNTKFTTDSSKFTRSTIMFAFYDGKNNIIFDNCQIRQSGESESCLHLSCLFRLGNSNYKCTAVLNNCYVNCDLYSSVFADATDRSSGKKIDNDFLPKIVLNNCTIASKNCPLNGNFVSYHQNLTGEYSTACVNMEINGCRINCAESLFDTNNQVINPVIFQIINSVVFISNTRSIGYFYSKIYEARYINTKFYTDEVLNEYFVNLNLNLSDNFNYDEFCPRFVVKNCYLNNEAFIIETN